MYFFALFFGYLLAYPLIAWWLQYFFDDKRQAIKLSWLHVVILFAWLFGVLILVRNFPDHEIGNRIQHALGGGFAIVLIVYYSCIASNVVIQRRQFFFLAFFLASCFGIFNELLESIMQIGWGMFFADSIEDTWYDLWSNSAGALLGCIFFTSLLGRRH